MAAKTTTFRRFTRSPNRRRTRSPQNKSIVYSEKTPSKELHLLNISIKKEEQRIKMIKEKEDKKEERGKAKGGDKKVELVKNKKIEIKKGEKAEKAEKNDKNFTKKDILDIQDFVEKENSKDLSPNSLDSIHSLDSVDSPILSNYSEVVCSESFEFNKDLMDKLSNKLKTLSISKEDRFVYKEINKAIEIIKNLKFKLKNADDFRDDINIIVREIINEILE